MVTACGTGWSPAESANACLAPQLHYSPVKDPSETVKAATVPGVRWCGSLLCCHWKSQQRPGSLLKKVSNYAEQFSYPPHRVCTDCDPSGSFCSAPFSSLLHNRCPETCTREHLLIAPRAAKQLSDNEHLKTSFLSFLLFPCLIY